MSDEEPSMTLAEAAAWLRVCAKTVRREIERGRLVAFRVGRNLRIKMSELRRYVEAHAVRV